MRGVYYLLDGHTPVPTQDVRAWGAMFEDLDGRRVGWTELTAEIAVSTVFIGLDHSFGGGPPILFETMIVGLSPDGGWDHPHRYATWDQAERGHELAVEWTRSVIDLAAQTAATIAICAPPSDRSN